MDKKKLQLSVIIGAVALLLVLVLVAGILLIPSSSAPVVQGEDKVVPVEVIKYDVTGRIFDANGNPMANTKFCISLGPTDFTTDENGFFILKNLPVGKYTLSGYDKDGYRIGTTVFQLSSDGTFSIGSYTFEKGAVVTLCFDGEKFFAVIVNENANNNTTVKPAEEEEDDPKYTNLSWMKNLEFDFGGYGLNPYRDPDMFYDVLNDEQYDMFNTYFLQGNDEYMVKQAKDLAAEGKKMWFSLNDLISVDGKDPATNLRGDWRESIDKYATMIYEVAGDYLQGFYFDEPSYHWTSMDFARVTEHIRKTYNRRVFAVHCKAAYLTPINKGFDIIGYKPARDDLMVISPENHKYVTDIGWWRYGSLERMQGIGETVDQYTKACSLIDPNTRKWYVPVAGTYDWLSTEEEALEINYEMFKYNSRLSNFGGIMLYTFVPGTLSGRPGEINPTDSRLTDADFLRDENDNYVYRLNTSKRTPVYMNEAGKYVYTDSEDNEVYMVTVLKDLKYSGEYSYKTVDGEYKIVEEYYYADGTPFEADKPDKDKLSRKVHLQTNNTIVGFYKDKYGIYDRDYEGCAAFYYLYPTAEDGGYQWPKMRQYLFILGEGMQAVYKGEKTFDDILAELGAVFTPDVTKYRDYQENEENGIDHSTQWYMDDYSDIPQKCLRGN